MPLISALNLLFERMVFEFYNENPTVVSWTIGVQDIDRTPTLDYFDIVEDDYGILIRMDLTNNGITYKIIYTTTFPFERPTGMYYRRLHP